MGKGKLNAIVISLFFSGLLVSGVLTDIINIIKGCHELNIYRFFMYRITYLYFAVIFYGISKFNEDKLNKFFSIGLFAIGIFAAIFSPNGMINGSFVLSFSILLFIDAYNFWYKKKALVIIIFIMVCLYIAFGTMHNCTPENLINQIFLNAVIVCFFYSYFYKDKVRYFEK